MNEALRAELLQMRGDEREELCAACYTDFMKGELLPVDEDEER